MKRSVLARSLLPPGALLLWLTGCSPHPATGTWVTADNVDSGFNRLEVTYEGRANLFTAGEQEAGRHCFWGGESAQAISMVCKPASNTDIEERYRLVVKDGAATLIRDGVLLSRFERAVR